VKTEITPLSFCGQLCGENKIGLGSRMLFTRYNSASLHIRSHLFCFDFFTVFICE
jgi:hypothetical protein